MRFVRRCSCVTAARFDGTSESAAAVREIFPDQIARHIERDDVLVVRGAYRLIPLRVSQWVTEDMASGHLRVWDDGEFRQAHESLEL